MRHGLAGARSECFPMDEAGHVRRLAMRELRGAHSAGSGLTLCAAIPTGNSMVEKHKGSVAGTCFQARHTAGCTAQCAAAACGLRGLRGTGCDLEPKECSKLHH